MQRWPVICFITASVLAGATACGDPDTEEPAPSHSRPAIAQSQAPTERAEDPACIPLLLELHNIDIDMKRLVAEMDGVQPGKRKEYDTVLADFEAAREQLKRALGQYQDARCKPYLGDDIIRTPPPPPEAPQTYTCKMPAVNYRPPVDAPDDNPGTRFSDGSPNCACAAEVLDRLAELHEHYLRQQEQFGPGSASSNNVLYSAMVGFDAGVQTSQGLYMYFQAKNCG